MSMQFADEELEELFTYHQPTPEQIQAYANVKSAALELAKVIRDNTPRCGSQTVAIRKLWELRMIANGAIATNGIF